MFKWQNTMQKEVCQFHDKNPPIYDTIIFAMLIHLYIRQMFPTTECSYSHFYWTQNMHVHMEEHMLNVGKLSHPIKPKELKKLPCGL